MGDRKRRFIHDTPGVIDDLEDQARWSSYGSHIPRPGNGRRQRLWVNRIHRTWARFPLVASGLLLVAFLVVVLVLAWVFSLFSD